MTGVPIAGGVRYRLGQRGAVRIPVPILQTPQTICVELRPRDYVPAHAELVFQDVTANRQLRLDYGYEAGTGMLRFRWHRNGARARVKSLDQAPVGRAGEATYRLAKYFRQGGRVLMLAGAAVGTASMSAASRPIRRAVGHHAHVLGTAGERYDWADGTVFAALPAAQTR